MSKQCLDAEQMKHLQELGLDTSNANFYWHRTKSLNNYNEWDEWRLYYGVLKLACGFTAFDCEYVSAFTLQDILDLLPKYTKYGHLQIRFYEYPNGNYGNEVVYDSMAHDGITFFCENVIDSAYEMLCLCIKEGFVKTNKED